MEQETQNTSNLYLLEIYEAIRLFTDTYVNYSNLARKATFQHLDDEEKKMVNDLISALRSYEEHAYIRLSVISENLKFDMKKIDEQRKELHEPAQLKLDKTDVPKREAIQELVKSYHRIAALQIVKAALTSTQQKVDDLTGRL